MQLLLRKLSSAGDDFQEYADSEVEADAISIGSSPECDIQLLGEGIAAIHARLQQRGGRARLTAEKGCVFAHNGRAVKTAELKPGDQITIGAQQFTCAEAPAGFDLALEWRVAEVAGHLLAHAYRTSLNQLKFSPRVAAWLLALSILAFAGIAPVLSYWLRPAKPEVVDQQLAFENLWLSGPLLDAHQVAIGNNCAACHEQAFIQVRDQACVQCHVDMADHVPAAHPEAVAFDGFACQNCHKEHNEPEHLIADTDQLCSNCHADMTPSVRGFSASRHPEFAATLLQPLVNREKNAVNVQWQAEKVALSPAPVETSHLKYPHDVHLDVDAVTHPRRGDALQCADCHMLLADREHFAPISMERHCADCHDLSFDPANPQQQLPHGAPSSVYQTLEAHYVKLAFNPQLNRGLERRRLPAREWEDERCDRDYACAQRQALRETEKQFLQRGCVTCHEVGTLANAEGGEQWQVLPVKLNADWYADARFDHRAHLTQAERSGDALCLTCHEATTSKASSDVLMPTLAQCTDCHGDRSVSDRVALNCIACHDYHRDTLHSFHLFDTTMLPAPLGKPVDEGAGNDTL